MAYRAMAILWNPYRLFWCRFLLADIFLQPFWAFPKSVLSRDAYCLSIEWGACKFTGQSFEGLVQSRRDMILSSLNPVNCLARPRSGKTLEAGLLAKDCDRIYGDIAEGSHDLVEESHIPNGSKMKGKRKAGRPIKYVANLDSPLLSETERKEYKRSSPRHHHLDMWCYALYSCT